jgi:hypothetical protein
MSRPSVREISALLADLAAYRTANSGDYAELMVRKADLLERIAAATPDSTDAAEVAAIARARANRLKASD